MPEIEEKRSLSVPNAMPYHTQQITRALIAFYQKPIAQVSTELFFTIGAVLFFAIFAIRPTIITMSELIKEIEDKRNTSEALAKKVAALSTAQTEYFSLQEQLYLLDEVFPSSADTEYFIKIIEKIASEQKLVITSLQVKEIPLEVTDGPGVLKQEQKAPVTFELSVTFAAEYPQIQQFITEVSQLRPLATVNSVTFSRNKQSEDSEELSKILTSTVQLSYHFFGKAPTKGTSAGQTAPPEANL